MLAVETIRCVTIHKRPSMGENVNIVRVLSVSVMLWACSPWAQADNLLKNPEFRFHSRGGSGHLEGRVSHNVACWNTDAWSDITVEHAADAKILRVPSGVVGVVRIGPGKRLYQFNTLPELGCVPGDALSLRVTAAQNGGGRLEIRMTVLRIESADGAWCPKDFGCSDDRTFNRHGRG